MALIGGAARRLHNKGKMNYKKLLASAVDLHMHVGPEIIPRKFNVSELIKSQQGKLKAIAIKSHFYPTTAFYRPKSADSFIIDSITLNNYVGGFNADAVITTAQAAKGSIIVWFPTISAKNFLQNEKYEIPEEWVGGRLKNNRLSKDINQLSTLDDEGNIKAEVKKVLKAIKNYNCILATGHISWQESAKLVEVAQQEFGITKIIITHPVYQLIRMPLRVQKKLARSGAFIEQCYSMYSIDQIPITKIARQIKAIGADRCILSSDVGQKFSPNPSEALTSFADLFVREGISKKELWLMSVINPAEITKSSGGLRIF